MKQQAAQWQKWLTESLAETLEAMAFAELEPCETCSWDDKKITCSIEFVSPIQGAIHLSLPLDLASELAWSAAGAELPEGEGDFIQDAVGEFLNTIAGRFLNKVLADTADFRVGLPTFGRKPGGPLVIQSSCRVNGNPISVGITEQF